MKVESLHEISMLPRDLVEVTGHSLSDAEVLALSEYIFIRNLDLSGSDLLTDVSVMKLRKITRLSELDLSFCNLVTDRSLEVLAQLPELRRLSLNACYAVTDCGLSALANATSIEEISLWSCEEITDAGIEALSHLPKLRQLELPEFAEITNIGSNALATNACKLEVLRLDHLAKISDEGVGNLCSLKRLTKLTVQSCEEATEASIVALQTALPSCQISFVRIR